MDEVNELTTRLVQFKGKVIENIRIELQLGIVNALWSIVAGARYNQEDPKLRELSYQLTGYLYLHLFICSLFSQGIYKIVKNQSWKRTLQLQLQYIIINISEHLMTQQKPADLLPSFLL